ncbi:hypothetical protein RvY_16491 [Ramazzottius varieornatus]|uniref:Cytochrome b561 domain-containing protein n=1 Tax=Ramazzottius varieornatus TaxID=947166 RepID=A0A1D1W670_RAMVA|nr:hypothetical protein RvY_16491 [Ramazzottius varieornatus]
MHCGFDLLVEHEVENVRFDLRKPYTLLLSSGICSNDTENPGQYIVSWHLDSDFPIVSDDPVVFACAHNCPNPPPVIRGNFGYPEGCTVDTDCQMEVTWGHRKDSDKIYVSLNGGYETDNVTAEELYIALGINQEAQMSSAYVIECVRWENATDKERRGLMQVDMFTSYNGEPHRNERIESTGVTLTSSSFDNGKVHCEYEVSTKLTVSGVTIPNGQVTDYDLTQPFHLLLAAGPLRKDTAAGQQNAKAWHGRDRRTASTKTFVLGGDKTVYNHCEGTRTCYGVPNNCVATKSCQQLLTYGVLAEGATSISMTLYGMPPNEESGVKDYWIGFGTSSHGKMKDTAVVQCVRYPDGRIDVLAGYNSPNTSLGQHGYELLMNKRLGVEKIGGSYQDGMLECSFTLDVVRNLTVTQSYEVMDVHVDLTRPYYLQLGSGVLAEVASGVIPGTHKKHPKVFPPVVLACSRMDCTGEPTARTTAAVPTAAPSKGGFFCLPADCSKARVDYRTSEKNSSRVHMKLTGKQQVSGWNGRFYVAVGFTRTQGMEFASVVDCVRWQNNGSDVQEVFGSYNKAGTANVRTDKNGIYLQSTSYEDDSLTCQFEMEFVRTIQGLPAADTAGQNLTFDLKQPMYILLALSAVRDGSQKVYHQTNKVVSDSPVDISAGGRAAASDYQKNMKKAHAILMVFAWMLFASFGILMARQTRDMWPLTQPFGLKMWFHAHRTSMVLVTVLTISAFIVIFVQAGGWVGTNEHPLVQSHAVLGCITFSLAMIQPFVALFRPHPGTPNRPYFNYFHWTLGYSTHVLSIVTMTLGTQLTDRLEGLQGVGFLILGSFLVNFALQVALKVYKRYRARCTKAVRANSFEALCREDVIAGPRTPAVAANPLDPNDPVRYGILTVNWLQISILSILMVVFIAVV